MTLCKSASCPTGDSLRTQTLGMVDLKSGPTPFVQRWVTTGWSGQNLKLVMCGIAGFWDPSGMAGEAELEQTALRMALALQHRGPDDQGTWADEHASLALGHRRLAILDLSSEGHQPMHSADKRYVLVFNGEIYNFEALRNSLEQRGHSFRGRSDTEVMLAAFCQWGILPALERLV